jgi:hypothetical protein
MRFFSRLQNKNNINLNNIMSNNKQNIRSVRNMHEYLEKVFSSIYSLYKIFRNFHDELFNLQNDLSFRPMSEQLIDQYNRLILFLYEQIKGILSISFVDQNSQEILVIKPVYNTKYSQDLELTYFTDDIIATKPLGSVVCMSINQINDEYIFLRSNRRFTFVTFEEGSEISINEFKDHVEVYIKMLKEIINWLHSDIQNVKFSIKTMVNIISEVTNMESRKYVSKWIEVVENLKKTVDEIEEIL